MKPNVDWIIGVHQVSDWAGYHALNHLCSLSKRPQGLVVLDDVIGRGVHMGVLARQMRVPDDLSIVVRCNEDSPIVFPRSWRQCGYNLAECGRIAVRTLRSLLAGQRVASKLKLPYQWHPDATGSPWETPNVNIPIDGQIGPMFRSGRQALETV
jgi:DNA-binding LacI/PurR family transcriptional regulator